MMFHKSSPSLVGSERFELNPVIQEVSDAPSV